MWWLLVSKGVITNQSLIIIGEPLLRGELTLKNMRKQAGAELCHAQVKLEVVAGVGRRDCS